MSRTHLVVVECTTATHAFELRHLVNVNAPRAAAHYVLQKLCPNVKIESRHDGATGLHITSGDLTFSVKTVQPVRCQDVLPLSKYYPVFAPQEQLCA